MKKKILVLLVLLVAASAVVFAQITRDEAEAIAIKDSGIPASSVEYIRSSLDWEHGERVYDVEFYADGVEYDYEIALSDGKILSFDSEAERIRHTRSSDELSRNDALLLALENAGYSEDEVGRIKVEKDWDDGYAVYEIEFRTSDYEYEYEISGEAEILSYSIEKRGRVRTVRDAAIMDRSEAEGVITSYLPEGVEIMRFERDYDDGRYTYEAKAFSDGIEYEVVIMPKMSFGTGHHATTCLMVGEMLDLPLSGCGLDMGSGTGVLAILAVQRGATHVDAIDIDSWAYENCRENIHSNGVEDRVTPYLGDAALLAGKHYDFVLANINRNILLRDMEGYVTALNPGGVLLLSGILEQDVPAITARAAALGLERVGDRRRDGWVAMRFVKA